MATIQDDFAAILNPAIANLSPVVLAIVILNDDKQDYPPIVPGTDIYAIVQDMIEVPRGRTRGTEDIKISGSVVIWAKSRANVDVGYQEFRKLVNIYSNANGGEWIIMRRGIMTGKIEKSYSVKAEFTWDKTGETRVIS